MDSACSGIGAIVLDESRCTENGCLRAYVGTGENSLRRHTYWGDGVYRVEYDDSSEFGSWSWQRLDTNEEFKYGTTAALVLDSDEVFVALSMGVTTTATYATRRAPEPSAGFGVHRRDPSGNWTRVFDTSSTIADGWHDLLLPTDLVKIPGTSDSFLLGVMNEGLFRTDDRGQTWCALNPSSELVTASQNNTISTPIVDCSAGTGLPSAGTFDHVEIATGPGGQSFALLGNCPSTFTHNAQGATLTCSGLSPSLYKTEDGGASWTEPGALSGDHYSRYTHALRVQAADQVLWGGLKPYRINTAGSILQQNPIGDAIHWDMHDLVAWAGWGVSGVVYAATDGGFYFYNGASGQWNAGNDSLVTTQFVSIALDYEDEPSDSFPRTTAILGGLQDNSNAAFNGTPNWELWGPVGDGGEALIQTPTITVDSTQFNSLRRIPGTSGAFSNFVGGARMTTGDPNTPFYSPLVQHEETKRLFVGTDVVSVRESSLDTWSGTSVPPAVQISPILGTAGNNFSQIETDRDVISAIAVAPSHQWRVYAGLYSGKILRTTVNTSTQPDPANSAHWIDIDTSTLPNTTVSSIAVHPNDHEKVWVAFSDFLSNAVYYTDNQGASWTSRSNGIPANEPVNVIKVVSNEPAKLWAGTDRGVYVSADSGATWSAKNANLPGAPVLDIEIDHHNDRIFAATHGRGVWMLQDENPLLTVFEGWMEEGIWDVPVYGTGFTCAQTGGCSCTIDVEREDGVVCATGTVDGAGNEVFIRQGEMGLATANQGSCTVCDGKPVAFACLNGNCMGGTSLQSCNAAGHRVSAVKVRCEENPEASGSIAGTCPEQANPPSSLFEVLPGLAQADGADKSASPANSTSAGAVSILLTPTVLASTPSGGDRALCSAHVEYEPADNAHQLAFRDALNESDSCQAAGITASLVQGSVELGEDRPKTPDRRLAISAPGTIASQMVLGVSVPAAEANGQCFNMSRLGIFLANQLAITQMRFPTKPGGAAGGNITVMENSPVGYCSMRVPTTAGQSSQGIAKAIAEAFQAPGVPQPLSCPESNNPRDIVQDGDSIVTVLPTSVHVCVNDANVGFSFGPHGIPVVKTPKYQYAAKLVCGPQKNSMDMRLARGFYATTVNLHNPNPEPVLLSKQVALAYPPEEQDQGELLHLGSDLLDPERALKTDCEDIRKRLFPVGFPAAYIEGWVRIESNEQLDVSGVYTTATIGEDGGAEQHSSMHIDRVPVRPLRERPVTPLPQPEAHPALVCYNVKARGRAQGKAEVTTALGTHNFGIGGLVSICEPVYKAPQREKLPDKSPPQLPLTCHKVGDEQRDVNVNLVDRNGFFQGPAAVRDPQVFCDVVQKKVRKNRDEGELARFPSPLTGYTIKAKTLREAQTVFTIDQFGIQRLEFRRSTHLFEPMAQHKLQAASSGSSPYHCFSVSESTSVGSGENARLLDEFGKYDITLGKPVLFCDPVDRVVQDRKPVIK